MKTTIIGFIKDILSDRDINFTNIKGDEHLRDTLGLTSFDLAALTVMIEDEYEVDVFENQMVFTLNEIIDVIKKES